jgi:hypothetical protein
VALATACGSATGRGERAASPADADRSRAFEGGEDEVLRDLAAVDPRIAQRTLVPPSEDDLRRVTMAAMLREDPTVAVVGGAIDPFSFDARARGLESARKRIGALPILPEAGSLTSERALLARLVDEELARLDEERALPRSASSLVRAIVDSWQAPKSEREAADVDRWLARRLAELHEVMLATVDPATALDVVRARELDDALDALEHLVSGYRSAMQELVRVREALEAASSKPATKARSEWSVIGRRARAHLGTTESPQILAQELAITEADLRARTNQALTAAGLTGDALAMNLEKQVFVSGQCIDAVPGSRVRSMAAAPEREPACHLRHLVSNIEDDATSVHDGRGSAEGRASWSPTAGGTRDDGRALALAVMHDHVVIAQWALDVARGDATIAEAQGRHRLIVPIFPDTRARYERIALARPVAAIGAGETVRILLVGDPKARAKAWSALGDVPLDVARRELR